MSKLHYTKAYHPQSDGKTERVNRCVENFLCCMTSLQPSKWSQWPNLEEWWHNTAYHSALKCSPFQSLYGYHPHVLAFAQSPSYDILGVDQFLLDNSAAFASIWEIYYRLSIIWSSLLLINAVNGNFRQVILFSFTSGPTGRLLLPYDATWSWLSPILGLTPFLLALEKWPTNWCFSCTNAS